MEMYDGALLAKFLVVLLSTMAAHPASIQRRAPRLSLAEWTDYNHHEPAGPGTYAFGYDIEDPASNNVQFRNEERHPNGTVTGSYGYVEPDGNVRIVHYIADHKGYRATEENNLKLSMLRPVRVEGVEAFSDPRKRPFDSFNTRVVTPPHQNFPIAHQQQIDNNYVPESDLFEASRFDFYPQQDATIYFPGYYYNTFQNNYHHDPRWFYGPHK